LNLQYDTEQIILRDTAESFLREHYTYDTYRRIVASEDGWSRELWDEFAQLGWLGLPFAADDGGIGGGATEAAILMEAFGRFLVVEPYLPTVLLAGGLITALGSAAERKALIASVSEGRSRLAFAFADRETTTTARPATSGFLLTGAKTFVIGAPMADTLLVAARIGAGAGDNRIGVFVVPKNAPGVATRPFRTVDGRRAADIDLISVMLPASALLGGNEDASATIDGVIDRAIAALSADAVGAIAAMVSATVEYTKTRVQFGQPLAKFQALQHRIVRMRIYEEEARASALFATLALEGLAGRRARAVSGAKAKIGRCARFVHQDAIQLHGAIGTTNELPLGAYAKRLLAYEALFGSTREHLRRYGSLICKPEIAAEGLLAVAG
jgi:alkylation response protein AidB-like acyl-CoA dehydrogenase